MKSRIVSFAWTVIAATFFAVMEVGVSSWRQDGGYYYLAAGLILSLISLLTEKARTACVVALWAWVILGLMHVGMFFVPSATILSWPLVKKYGESPWKD